MSPILNIDVAVGGGMKLRRKRVPLSSLTRLTTRTTCKSPSEQPDS